MQDFPEYVMQLRTDVRLLRVETDRLRRAHVTQKQKAEQFSEQLKEQEQRIKDLEKENERLKGELEQSSKTKKRYQVALFDHGNFRHPARGTKKKKGGQPGHADTNREAHQEQPESEKEHLYVPVCGQCGEALARVKATRHKELVDIVLHPQVKRVRVESERQWCGHCNKEVTARDGRSLPFTEYGLNTFLLVMILRFTSHASLSNIASVLQISHGLAISKAAVCNLLAQAKKYLKGHFVGRFYHHLAHLFQHSMQEEGTFRREAVMHRRIGDGDVSYLGCGGQGLQAGIGVLLPSKDQRLHQVGPAQLAFTLHRTRFLC